MMLMSALSYYLTISSETIQSDPGWQVLIYSGSRPVGISGDAAWFDIAI
jgi:hypothetical protein